MKRPESRLGDGNRPASRSGARGKSDSGSAKQLQSSSAERRNLNETGKILASVTSLSSRRKPDSAPAKPQRAAKPAKRVKATKPASRVRPTASATPTPRRKVFERLSPEAARFRAYSRRRRAILSSVVGAFLALILLMLASMYTPMLAVEQIRVVGLSRLKVSQIQGALKGQLGVPLPMVQSSKIGDALRPYPLIESFAVTSRPPHTLVIRITERTPICIVNVGNTNYLFDPAGVKVGVAGSNDAYPTLTINGDPSSSAQYKLAMDVLLALPASLLPRVASIDAKTKDNVTMQLRGNAGQKIVWGDASSSALKSKVLAALLRNYKKSERVTFDVSSPTAPVVRY
mgnify:CR=1 FL=1